LQEEKETKNIKVEFQTFWKNHIFYYRKLETWKKIDLKYLKSIFIYSIKKLSENNLIYIYICISFINIEFAQKWNKRNLKLKKKSNNIDKNTLIFLYFFSIFITSKNNDQKRYSYFLMVELIIRIYRYNFHQKKIDISSMNWNVIWKYIYSKYFFKSNMKLKYWNINIFLFAEEIFRNKCKK
jgi:hypothetical protein